MRADFNAYTYSSIGKDQGHQVKDIFHLWVLTVFRGFFAFLIYLKQKKLLSSKFPMCKKEKYVALVGCGLISIVHGLGGGFGTCLLWAEWTPVFLQLFDLPNWCGCYRKDIAFCNRTNSRLIAGWSTNIKTLQPLYHGRRCALLFKSVQSSTPEPRAKTCELNEHENMGWQRNRNTSARSASLWYGWWNTLVCASPEMATD